MSPNFRSPKSPLHKVMGFAYETEARKRSNEIAKRPKFNVAALKTS